MTTPTPETTPSLDLEAIEYIEAAQVVAGIDTMMRDFQVYELLQPLAEYYPDATEPLHALMRISHRYDWPVEEVTSVIIDIENKYNPTFANETLATAPPREIEGSLFQGRATKIVDRPLPDGWDDASHDAAQWLRRAEIAEDITLYFAHGAKQLLQKRSPANLFDAAKLLKPYWDYGEDCTIVAQLIEEKGKYMDYQEGKVASFHQTLHAAEPPELDALMTDEALPVNQEHIPSWQRFVNQLVLSALRDLSDRTFTSEDREQLDTFVSEAKHELRVEAQRSKQMSWEDSRIRRRIALME